MTQALTIAILDNNRYFAQGLEALLLHYFTLRRVPVRFLPERRSADATLLFQSNDIHRNTRFCRQRNQNTQQQVIIVQDTPRPRPPVRLRTSCLSERGMIDRRIGVKALLLDVERVLLPDHEQHTGTGAPRRCPRCSPTLTPRELQVLAIMEQGRLGQQAARLMNLSPKTISAHKCSAMSKLGFIRSTELYHWLQSGGLNHETHTREPS